MHKTVMIIAGSDSDGAAGLQGDIKTLAALRLYSTCVVTAVTAQNTQGVQAVFPVPATFVGAQIEAVVSDIPPDAVKIGMLATAENVEVVATLIEALSLKNIVLDPVLRASTGVALLEEKGIEPLKKTLFPLVTVITPNVEEASRLAGVDVNETRSMQEAAKILHDFGPKFVIIKGGHLDTSRPLDLLYDGKKHSVYDANRVASRNTHGLGDAFASVVAARLAVGERVEVGIDMAKKYIVKAMNHPFAIGKGEAGPLNHGVPI
ncbi:MAG: bifunctional hydroxymethylpyrimidine kinase/phosphomethylpyrimidine kinase [Acidobacteriota bacterium]|nr:MAG: bifunctional hydroxymethylpyrimidine kinase/phosphomethylpyrimidine kinase [Acidobacteriota bacterium]